MVNKLGIKTMNTQSNEVLRTDYQAEALSVQETFVDSSLTTRPALGQGDLETRPGQLCDLRKLLPFPGLIPHRESSFHPLPSGGDRWAVLTVIHPQSTLCASDVLTCSGSCHTQVFNYSSKHPNADKRNKLDTEDKSCVTPLL